MNLIIAIIISYLLGSIPFAFILTKIIKNVDLRKIGSGNIGATNAIRVVGIKIGIIALLLDIAKGILPVVWLASRLSNLPAYISPEMAQIILGIASVCGHNWTIFLGFRGGKGIATSFGVLIGLAIKNALLLKVILALAAIWIVSFLTWGYVSLSSLLSAFFLPIFLLFFRSSTTIFCFGLLLAVFAIYRHKLNVLRLLRHEENRFDIKSKLSALKKKALP